MRKIFTLIFVSVFAVSAVLAETVTVRLYGQIGENTNNYGPDFDNGILGTMECELVLNEDGSYTMPSFLGVNKAVLDFYIDKTVSPAGMEPARYAFVVKFAEVPAAPVYVDGVLNYPSIDEIPTIDDYSSIIVAANSFGTQFNYRIVNIDDDFNIDLYGNPEIRVVTDDDRRKSAVFTGEDSDYILLSPYYWCLNSSNDNTGMSAIVKRSYFSVNGDRYTVTLQGSCASYFYKDGDEWPKESTGQEFKHYLVFDLPVNAGIDNVIVDNAGNAPVEYYNLQGIRVGNPVKGRLYIKRQGAVATRIVY